MPDKVADTGTENDSVAVTSVRVTVSVADSLCVSSIVTESRDTVSLIDNENVRVDDESYVTVRVTDSVGGV